MAFHLGQRIICIYDWPSKGPGIIIPQQYSIYTIRAFCPCAATPALLLHEIHNSQVVRFVITRLKGEPSFGAKHFRPLVNLYETFSISNSVPTKKELQNV